MKFRGDVLIGGGHRLHYLICPRCRGDNLHHGAVTVYDRAEDDSQTLVMDVRSRRTRSRIEESKNTANPSSRRSGIAIEFWCENCDNTSELTIAQHKGTSFLEWRGRTFARGGEVNQTATEDAA
jgi:hypothetical protein